MTSNEISLTNLKSLAVVRSNNMRERKPNRFHISVGAPVSRILFELYRVFGMIGRAPRAGPQPPNSCRAQAGTAKKASAVQLLRSKSHLKVILDILDHGANFCSGSGWGGPVCARHVGGGLVGWGLVRGWAGLPRMESGT